MHIRVYSPTGKIRVAHIVPCLEMGGMENGVVNVCNRLDRSKFEPMICCLNRMGTMAERLYPDVHLTNVNLPEGRHPFHFFKTAHLLRKLRPHIVHTHAWGGGSLYGIIGAKLTRVSVIINGEHGSFFLRPHQVMLQRALAAMCDMTLSVSESLKEQVVKNLGMPPEKIKVIPNGVDIELFSGKHDCSYLRQELQNRSGVIIDDDSIVIGCVASLKPEKNQTMLLKALLELRTKKSLEKIRVILVGDGPDRTVLEKFVSQNRLNKNVAFMGNRDDVPQLLSVMDIFVSTSISRHEGMSNVILEALSSSLPVIATRSIGTSELVDDESNGYLVDENDIPGLANRIELLVNDTALRAKMGHNARNTAESKYSIFRMIKNYEKLYIDTLKGKGL